jgi:uncharacterized membrane protein
MTVTDARPAPALAPPHPRDVTAAPPGFVPTGRLLVAIGVYQLAVSAAVLAGVAVPWLSPVLGLGAVLGTPLLLIALADPGHTPTVGERLVWSVPLALLALMAAAVGFNTLAPHIGVDDPLGTRWTVAVVDGLCLLLAAGLYHRYRPGYVVTLPTLPLADRRVLAAAAVVLVAAVMGANRLNNGAGGGLTLIMLVGAGVVLAVLAVRADHLSATTVLAGLYLVSLALLYMTSLRGWFVTGHDVQREFIVFQLSSARQSWDMAAYPDAYNACLSITVLPTVLARWVPVEAPYIYKTLFPLLCACCPVGVYLLGHRFTTRRIAFVGATFFIAFVTFFQDMPMLNRQAIAFLFFVAAMLAVFHPNLDVASRKRWLCLFAAGMVVAHYSTTYMALGILTTALVLRTAMRTVTRRGRRRRGVDPVDPPEQPAEAGWRRGSPLAAPALAVPAVVTIVPLAVIAAMAFVWVGPLTHTDRGLSTTIGSAVRGLRGDDDPARSNDTAYGLLSGAKVSDQQRLDAARARDMAATAEGRARGEYYDRALIDPLATPVLEPDQLPLTAAGRALSRVIDVPALNGLTRRGSALGLQVLVLVGLASVALSRRRPLAVPAEYLFLAGGSVLVIAVQLVAPVLSVEYGLLRSFQQALVLLDIFLVAGIAALVPRRWERMRTGVATAAALGFFASTTGVITQSLGGYAPQLHLNNAGTYYDIYYLHPEELAATSWLRDNTVAASRADIQSEIQTDRYTFTRFLAPQQLSSMNDIAPPLLRRSAYVFLGYANVTRRQSTVVVASDLVTYRYPIEFLDGHKDLVYSSGGARVYH